MLLVAAAIVSNVYAQPRQNFIISYSVGVPTGSLSDYIGAVSYRGLSLEYAHGIGPKLDLTLEGSWNRFYERADKKVYTEGTVSMSGVQYRYEHAIPLIAGAKLHFLGGSKVKPYAGLGVGTMYIDRDTDFGLYRFSGEAWQFCVRPEAGIRYEYERGRGIILGAKYYSGSGTDDLDGQTYFAINLGIVL